MNSYCINRNSPQRKTTFVKRIGSKCKNEEDDYHSNNQPLSFDPPPLKYLRSPQISADLLIMENLKFKLNSSIDNESF
jgi:hypothetical protein